MKQVSSYVAAALISYAIGLYCGYQIRSPSSTTTDWRALPNGLYRQPEPLRQKREHAAWDTFVEHRTKNGWETIWVHGQPSNLPAEFEIKGSLIYKVETAENR